MFFSFQELRIKNVSRCESQAFNHKIHDWLPSQWSNAHAGEVGELMIEFGKLLQLCNTVKKHDRGDDINKELIADEIADIVIYLDLLAARLGIELSSAVVKKFNTKSDEIGSKIKIVGEISS